MFVGRSSEIQTLSDAILSSKQENILIYGRRRIGKSELVKHVIDLHDVPSIYYQAKETSIEDNISSLSALVVKHYSLPSISFNSIESILDFVFTQTQQPVCLVIDEYPYLSELMTGLDSVLQKIINQYKHQSKVKLILLGSYIDVMQSLNDANRPLFGRFTHSLFIGELDYREASEFYADCSDEDKLRYYSVFGGVPYYLQLIDPKFTFVENVIRLVIVQHGQLSDFVEFFLTRELRRINNAHAVLETIALGSTKFSDILGKLQASISSSQLANVLDLLIRMDLIDKTTPINDSMNSKRTFYSIKDNYIRFYYRYVFRNLSARALLKPEIFYLELIDADFNTALVPMMFEHVALQYLHHQNKQGKINPPFIKLGKLWFDDPVNKVSGEFDVVGQSLSGFVIYEAKYTNAPVNDKVVNELINQLNRCKLAYQRLGFFAKSSFSVSDPKAYYLRTLADLYR